MRASFPRLRASLRWAMLLLVAAPCWRPLPAQAAPDSQALFQALQRERQALARAEARLAEARRIHLDVPRNRAELSVSLAKMALDSANLLLLTNGSVEEAKAWLGKGAAYTHQAHLHLTTSRGAEARGMLIDASSIPKTEAGVVQLVAKLADAHFNLLIPEVYRRGYTVYGSRFTQRDPEFQNAPDLLRVMLREAHARGMEVHPWLWTFRARSPGYGNPLLARLPALAARQEGKETRFFSAASPQAREYLFGLIGELTDRYDVDGLLLDYIRYDEEIPEDEISRTRFALEYKARTGQLPPSPIPPRSPLAVQWQLWREQQVHLAVQEISRQLRARRPHFPIGVANFRGESYARLVKMQHWRHWANNRWIDWAAPMLYTSKPEDLERWVGWETDGGRRDNLLYPILGVHRFARFENLFEQIELLRRLHQPGLSIFAMAHFAQDRLGELRLGPFREPAVLPHRHLLRGAKRLLQQAARYMDRVHDEADLEVAASARTMTLELEQAMAAIPPAEAPPQAGDQVVARTQALKALAQALHLPAGVRQELAQRLDDAAALARAHRFQSAPVRLVPTSLPPMPMDGGDSGPRD